MKNAGWLVATLAMGCVNDPIKAPPSATISINPNQIEVAGSVFNAEDNVGIVRFADIVVLDDGAPLESIEVEVVGPNFGVFIIPTEAVKLVLSGAAYLHSVHASAPLGQGWADSLRKDLAVHASWRSYLEFAVPAAIYALENNINYWALKNLKTPMAFVVFGHVETPLVALLSVVVLRRQYSGYQWMAIFLLVDGVMQTEMAICEAEGNGRCSRLADFPVASLAAVMISRAVAAVAGISTEFLFKRRLDTSIYLQNVQLYSFGVLTNLVILGMREPHRYNEGTFFEGFTPVVGGVILCAALQGMFVSAVIKHMSSLEKCFASGAAIFLNAVISAWNGHFDLNVAFFLGSLVVIVSITLYAMEDKKTKAKGGGAGAGERAGEGEASRRGGRPRSPGSGRGGRRSSSSATTRPRWPR